MRNLTSIFFLILSSNFVFAQKAITEATVVYDIVVSTSSNDPKLADAFDGATSTVYIKGTQSRTDMTSVLGNESTIYDGKTGNAFILKEYSAQKLMITLTKQNWEEKNKTYNNLTYVDSFKETKTINGYNCKKVLVKLASGKVFTVFYAPDLIVTNKDYNATFKQLPGLVLQYEFESGKTKFIYTASKINIEPVPSTKFDAPKSGYRIMTYEENKNLKKEGN